MGKSLPPVDLDEVLLRMRTDLGDRSGRNETLVDDDPVLPRRLQPHEELVVLLLGPPPASREEAGLVEGAGTKLRVSNRRQSLAIRTPFIRLCSFGGGVATGRAGCRHVRKG